jgi:primosomal protein N' (replication factor Y) (superfamily II helicase)
VTAPTSPHILKVALDTPLRRTFDYLPPPGVAGRGVQPGMRVAVPLGRRRAIGFVVGVADTTEVPPARLKAAIELLDPEPLWDAQCFDLLLWAADYYQHPLGEVLAASIPAALRRGAPAVHALAAWQLSATGLEQLTGTGLRLGPRQRELVERLRNGPVVAAEVSAAQLGPALRSLARRGWVEPLELPAPAPAAGSATTRAPPLTAAQRLACDAIAGSLGGFTPWLLHGVTGSGKTEVYLDVIERVLAAGQGALVLVPEIALTPQLVGRFRGRLPVPVVTLHSSMTDAERLEAWQAARSGAAPVVIGTRSAVFTPLPAPGVILVDEEHDASYKQQDGFRYSARDLAVARAARHRIPVVLGSATPSLESLANATETRYRKLLLPERAGSAGKPRVGVVDLRLHAARDGLAQPVIAAIERHLADRGQVLVYLNRRGYAPTLFCSGCGWIAPCPACDARMTVHMARARLVCHHCGADAPLPFGCPKCGSEVSAVGQGTERVEQALAELFPQAPLVRVDRDVIRRRGDIERALEEVASGRARILLGTQMLTKGHDYPDVTLVAVLNADQGLFGADFRASERLAQQIVQVAGRAGRGHRPGEVLIQSAYPENPLLVSLVTEGYEGFALRALAERRDAAWPPYSRLALLRADSPERGEVYAFLRAAAAAAPDLGGVRLLGPAPASMERRAGRYRAQLLLEASTRPPLKRWLEAWLPQVEQLKHPRQLRWSVDVDPIEVD